MLSAFTNCLKIPELRQRIFMMLSLLFIARIGANIPLPGLDMKPLQDYFAEQTASGGGSLVGLYNMFTGGAFLRGAVFALGIMPYISASIIFQLMGAVFPALARLQQEGESGRQKLNQYTRYATVVICAVQAVLLILGLQNPGTLFQGFSTDVYGQIVIIDKIWFLITSTIFLTAGTVLLMWIGEQITKLGIGNGISILITVGIIADLPGAAQATYDLFFGPVGVQKLVFGHGILLAALLLVVTAGLIMVIQAVRKIPVQYAKRVVGRKVYGGQSSFMPLKVNYSGVMPVIFASALLAFPQQIISQIGAALDLPWLVDVANYLVRGSVTYYVVFGLMILFFSYFWVSVMFRPIQIADDLKKYGGYVPGVRPGQPTAKFLDFVMTRLTLAGAIFLTIISVFPDVLLFAYDIPMRVAIFFGGTGMLITVGVALDTMKQIETHLLQRHYDGFLKKGRIRGRSQTRGAQSALGEATDLKNVGMLYAVVLGIGAVGLIAYFLQYATN
ncbi:preprotein translocase subunit SecY [Pelagicoccus sp. SDUM812003]|uniref:preprotein translocase subunit SecY n=1 Tax=Pelagicoccus sp. SDUM812003 TaxID=3041267 RepID=UPI00280F2B2D|nr:preprotein translocase subunit SecY [Pelagicoccus sp. SDUM812003]MDQ8204833.1 preprotein translocase subunit SecY [Pelagicoccus sp. SDUM812003]